MREYSDLGDGLCAVIYLEFVCVLPLGGLLMVQFGGQEHCHLELKFFTCESGQESSGSVDTLHTSTPCPLDQHPYLATRRKIGPDS